MSADGQSRRTFLQAVAGVQGIMETWGNLAAPAVSTPRSMRSATADIASTNNPRGSRSSGGDVHISGRVQWLGCSLSSSHYFDASHAHSYFLPLPQDFGIGSTKTFFPDSIQHGFYKIRNGEDDAGIPTWGADVLTFVSDCVQGA